MFYFPAPLKQLNVNGEMGCMFTPVCVYERQRDRDKDGDKDRSIQIHIEKANYT